MPMSAQHSGVNFGKRPTFSVTLIGTVKLLGPNKLVRPLTQADILSSQCKANPRSRYGDPGRTD